MGTAGSPPTSKATLGWCCWKIASDGGGLTGGHGLLHLLADGPLQATAGSRREGLGKLLGEMLLKLPVALLSLGEDLVKPPF